MDRQKGTVMGGEIVIASIPDKVSCGGVWSWQYYGDIAAGGKSHSHVCSLVGYKRGGVDVSVRNWGACDGNGSIHGMRTVGHCGGACGGSSRLGSLCRHLTLMSLGSISNRSLSNVVVVNATVGDGGGHRVDLGRGAHAPCA